MSLKEADLLRNLKILSVDKKTNQLDLTLSNHSRGFEKCVINHFKEDAPPRACLNQFTLALTTQHEATYPQIVSVYTK